jgi:hypothetical protein
MFAVFLAEELRFNAYPQYPQLPVRNKQYIS